MGLVRAYNLHVPWTASFVAMVLLRLSAVIPQAPGNIGSFHWVAARAMIMFGLDSQLARRFLHHPLGWCNCSFDRDRLYRGHHGRDQYEPSASRSYQRR